MKTSRIEGTLVLHTKVPYKMIKNGVNQEATEIICKEINFACEGAANDLEQLFTGAITDWSLKNKGLNQGATSNPAQEKKAADYKNSDSPSEKDVDEQALMLESMFKINTVVKVTDMQKLFEQFINGGLILAEGEEGVKMTSTSPIWMSIDRKDKLRIMYSYISFFVQPLSSLVEQSTTAQEKSE